MWQFGYDILESLASRLWIELSVVICWVYEIVVRYISTTILYPNLSGGSWIPKEFETREPLTYYL
jgi:hypothetical protein